MKSYGKGESKLFVFLLLLCVLAGCSKIDKVSETTEVEKQKEDVEALQKIIEGQNTLGAHMSTDLNCSDYTWDENGRLTKLSISNRNLQGRLSCAGLPALKYLDCGYNKILILDVSENTILMHLNCGGNRISDLNVSQNPALWELRCWENQISSLDVGQNTMLRKLWCWDNEISSLDVSVCMVLETLYCRDNQISSLNVSQNTELEFLYCNINQLSSLDVSNCPSLKHFRCDENNPDIEVIGWR